MSIVDDKARLAVTELNRQSTTVTSSHTYSATWDISNSATAGMNAAILSFLRRASIVGGNAYVKQALRQSSATRVDALGRQLAVAEGFSQLLRAFEALVGAPLSGFEVPDFHVAIANNEAAQTRALELALTALKSVTSTDGNAYALAALKGSTATDLDTLERQVRVALNYSAGLQSILDSFGGKLPNPDMPSFDQAFASEEEIAAFVESALLEQLRTARIEGGDIFVKRAIAHSAAATIAELSVDIAVAVDYARYLANKGVIDALIAQNDQSAFAAGWLVTLLKASDLQLDVAAAGDFVGGIAGFVKGFNVERYGLSLHDVSLTADAGTLTMTLTDPVTGRVQEFALGDYAARASLTLLTGDAGTGTAGNDLWIAPDAGGIFTDATIAEAAFADTSSDLLLGGIGDDVINAGAGHDYVDGGAGDDTIAGGAGGDILVGGAGTDVLEGGAGDDTYVFGRGDGADTIRDVAMSEVTRTETVTRQLVTETPVVQDVEYSVPRRGTWKAARSSGKTGPYDSIYRVYGDGDRETIRLPAGARLVFGTGEDINIVEGYILRETRLRVRQQTVEEDITTTAVEQVDGGRDTLRFGSGVTVEDLFMRSSGSSMIIALREADETGVEKPFEDLSDTVTIENWDNPHSRIETLAFADGTIVDLSTIDAAESNGADDGIVAGSERNDFLSAGAGDDHLTGSAGSDILLGGAGRDTVDYSGMSDGITIDLSNGTAAKSDSAGDRLFGIENVIGSAHDDILFGDDGDNVLSGGAGDDTLAGGAGSNTYLFARGDGRDTISSGAVHDPASTNELRFGGGIAASNLLFSRSGNALVISILGTEDRVSVEGWFSGQGNAIRAIDRFTTADGLTLRQEHVEQLLEATSGFPLVVQAFSV